MHFFSPVHVEVVVLVQAKVYHVVLLSFAGKCVTISGASISVRISEVGLVLNRLEGGRFSRMAIRLLVNCACCSLLQRLVFHVSLI